MKRNKRGGSGGANWMDTYGDMVTLLLCFFVMLFAMSTMDQQKWQQIVQSLNPEAVQEATEEVPAGQSIVSMPDPELTQAQVEQDIENLYQAMKQYIESAGMSQSISIGKGSGYVFISFDDTVFFNGDSYVLLDTGKQILDQVAASIANVSESIDEIRVLGHTAQADPDSPNNPEVDRFLASNRSAVVTVYLQEKNVIDPACLVSVGYGQWRPVAKNDTRESRAHNRRVEIIVTGINPDDEGGSVTQYYTMRGAVDGSARQDSPGAES